MRKSTLFSSSSGVIARVGNWLQKSLAVFYKEVFSLAVNEGGVSCSTMNLKRS